MRIPSLPAFAVAESPGPLSRSLSLLLNNCQAARGLGGLSAFIRAADRAGQAWRQLQL